MLPHSSFILSFVGAGALALGLAVNVEAQCVSTSDGSGQSCQTLFAGQTIDAGTVCFEVVDSNLVITFTTSGGWELVETHTWVGTNTADMPQTKTGNPKVGNFPYHSGDITGSTNWSLSIPLTNLNFACPGSPDTIFYVAAHAAVRRPDGSGGFQTETGWGDGTRFVTKGNWGTYSTITLTCDCASEPPEEVVCETAFAYGGTSATCFLDLDTDGDGNITCKDPENHKGCKGDPEFNRWGWTNGGLAAGTYTFDIYAAAGQCDVTKGLLVGTLTVVYDGTTATVTYDVASPFYMEETHLYVGAEVLARDVNNEFTVAPGQYPYIHDVVMGTVSDTYTVNASGLIYVVAHSVVCGPASAWN